MLAFIYLAIMWALGDSLCRRFYSFVTLPHRLAASFLVGLLLSSWATYLGALAVGRNSASPLLWSNLLFFIAAVALILRLRRHAPGEPAARATPDAHHAKANRWDWAFIGLFFVFSWWMMFSSFNMEKGRLQIANHQWSDFGATVSIMQSFALGHNFPTEYPHFSGDRIRYHFLFYFQAGNLEYLGLNPAWSNNLLSVLSLVSMLVLVMTLGTLLFRSRAVGRVGAALFFFHGSLSYLPFLIKHGSLTGALAAAAKSQDFLPSGFPYRGEEWGVWSLVNFINQRHFASAIGILLLAVVFLVARARPSPPPDGAEAPSPDEMRGEFEAEPSGVGDTAALARPLTDRLRPYAGFIFTGALLGLLPMWNSAVFVAAFAVLALLFLLFPLKRQMLALALTTAALALPQVVYLRTGNMREAGYSLFHWGYTLDNPTFANVLKYLGFTFGFKWLLIAFALYLGTRLQRSVMLAASGLIAVAFLFRFSDEVLANHKFLNMWLIVANLFVGYGLWRLWHTLIAGSRVPGKVAAAALAALVTFGGVLDLFPIRNSYFVEIPFEGDRLVGWVREQTNPRAIFLTDRFVTHRIMLAGRHVFHGWPYFTWSAGHLTPERDVIYKRMFEERNPQRLLSLLRENNISYVAIDNGVRRGGFIKNVNEAVYEKYFAKVFQDTENEYDALSIYKVAAGTVTQMPPASAADSPADEPSPINAFEGGRGKGRGQFDGPRGIALSDAGQLYVADTANSRIQMFTMEGEFVGLLGKTGTGEGELREPNGMAFDAAGDIYVADALNHRVIKFKADGTYQEQWAGPEPGFYGPRDIAVGPDKHIYVVDQGRARIVKLSGGGKTLAEWGKQGSGDGEFYEPTAVAVDGQRVYVADANNTRIQVFDTSGKFVAKWDVEEWRRAGVLHYHYPDLILDSAARRLYVSSIFTDEVLVYDLDGNKVGTLRPAAPDKFEGPTAMTTSKEGHLYVLNFHGVRVSKIDPGQK
ncbi:MAG: SMP-30/gluconolactonase/LRE family protein [Rubrivivax sp.]|nr:SMP-30/gluconolactonase/LRE family protein [Pyrinomonadaceae bacterium]